MTDNTTEATPLLAALRVMSPAERERCARLAGTTVNYLYQVGTCERPRPSAEWAVQVADAISTMHEDSGERIPLVSVREIATMCALRGLDA